MSKKVTILLLLNNNCFDTINSILNQTYTDYQLIIIDKFSYNKHMQNLLNSNKIKYINYETNNDTESINLALKENLSEFILIANSNTIYFNDCLEIFIKTFNNGQWSNIAFSSYVCDNKKIKAQSIIPIDYLFNLNVNYPIMFRKSSIQNLVFNTNLNNLAIFDFYIQILENNKHLLAINKVLVNNKVENNINDEEIHNFYNNIINRNKGEILDINNYYPFIKDCKDKKRLKTILNNDLGLSIANKESTLKKLLVKNLEKYFELSFNNDINFKPSLINLIISLKEKNMDYNYYYNLLNEDDINKYKTYIENNTYINTNISKEEIIVKKNIYYKRNTFIYEDNKKEIKTDNNELDNIIQKNNKIFIYYSKTPWTLLFQRPHQICRFFDKTYLKIFICSESNMNLYEEKYNLFVISHNNKDNVFSKFNNYEEKIIYYTDPRLFEEVNKIKETGFNVLFDLIDAPIDEFSVWKPNLEKSVKNADWIMYSHPKLVDFLNEIDKSKDYYYISNGCDYEHFSKSKERIYPKPSDIPEKNKPILGYYGAFSEWIDYNLIKKYADEGKYHILMIGGIPGNSKYNIKFEHENITWLEHKSYEELPIYLSWFDVCFLPFKECELNKYVNPCKLWEYMASEKEIIKSNININNDKIITYIDINNKLIKIINGNFKNKVAIITNMYLDWKTLKPSIGGGERWCNELINLLKIKKCEIDLHQLGNDNLKIKYNNINIFIHKNIFENNGEFITGFSKYINKVIKNKYSLVIYLMPELCCSDNIIENSLLINHGIWFDRNVKNNNYFDLLKLQVQKCRKIICVDTNYINFIRSYWGYNFGKNKLYYVPNFVDNSFMLEKSQKKYDNKLTILFPRRANIYRGSKIMPDILKNITDDVNFIWCGGGEDATILKFLEKTDPRFKFTTANFDEIIKYYEKSNIVVIPTIASEGTSLSCLEGMATYNVVLSTNVGGLPNLIIDNFNGFLCNNDSEDICKKLNYIIKNYEIISDRICLNAQNTVKNSFSKDMWDNKINDIINNFFLSDKKIAIVTKNCINGGVESIIKLHQNYLNCKVFICGGKIDENNKPFIFEKNLLSENDAIETLKDFDIIISHWVPNYIQNAYVSIAKKVNIFEYVHREDTNDNSKVMLDGIITHSDFLKDIINKNLLIKKQISVLNHPINCNIFRPIDYQKKKIGIIGSYNQFKGIEIFINAINLIKNNICLSEYELCIYGKDDGLKEKYFKLSNKLNLNIQFNDSISDVHNVLNQFEILCIPSTLEGFPVILCEALSCNLKVIASNIVGIQEFYNKTNEYEYNDLFCLFKSTDHNELAEKIINILTKKIKINNHKGNEFIKKYYSLETHFNNLNNIIMNLYKEKNGIINTLVFKNNYSFEKSLDYFNFYKVNVFENKLDILNSFKDEKFEKKYFLRIIPKTKNNNYELSIIFNEDYIPNSIIVQIDILDENNKLYYNINEYHLNDSCDINFNINIPNKHKLSCINLIPNETIFISNFILNNNFS